MKHRCKVLRIIPTLDPKYGGPAATIIDSSLLLYKDGFKVDILTADEENSNFIKKIYTTVFIFKEVPYMTYKNLNLKCT